MPRRFCISWFFDVFIYLSDIPTALPVLLKLAALWIIKILPAPPNKNLKIYTS